MGINFNGIFSNLKEKIRDVYNDNYELQQLLENVVNFIENNEEVKEIIVEISLFVSMLRDHLEGRYKGLSKESIYLMIGALIYIISPIDIIPDFLLLGYLDDFLIIWYLMKKLSKEIDDYRRWKASKDGVIFELKEARDYE